MQCERVISMIKTNSPPHALLTHFLPWALERLLLSKCVHHLETTQVMLSHLPVEWVRIYQFNFTKLTYYAKFPFYQKTENTTTSQDGSEFKFFSSKKKIVSFRCNLFFFSFVFVCLVDKCKYITWGLLINLKSFLLQSSCKSELKNS